MKKLLYQSISLSVLFFILLGVMYPLLTMAIGKFFFPAQTDGSLISINHVPVGSRLIGQQFTEPKYFHGRPSSAGKGYDGTQSSASNLAVTNQALYTRMQSSIQQVLRENPGIQLGQIPTDLVTSSGSGLDPHISVQAALLQIPRVAKARHISAKALQTLVDQNIQHPWGGFLGENTVNVLQLNLNLDKM